MKYPRKFIECLTLLLKIIHYFFSKRRAFFIMFVRKVDEKESYVHFQDHQMYEELSKQFVTAILGIFEKEGVRFPEERPDANIVMGDFNSSIQKNFNPAKYY